MTAAIFPRVLNASAGTDKSCGATISAAPRYRFVDVPRGALCLAINKFRDQGEPVFLVRDGRLIPHGGCLIIHGDEVSGLKTRSINRALGIM